MRAFAFLLAFAFAVLLAGCAGHARNVPASAGFSTPGPPPEGTLSAGPQTPAPTTRATPAAPPAAAATAHPAPAAAAIAPKSGEPTYVDVLPEAITRVPPSYPDAARAAGISGTVTVQAYVRTDGSVGDTRILNSVRGLDEAAAAAVKQWRFKPATVKGEPVAWWVSVPVKFSLH